MKLLRDPLVHFIAIGAVLFGVYNLAGAGGEAAPDDIVVSAGQIDNLKAVFSRTWQRPPSSTELDSLVAEHVRDEIIYREAITMGLDRDDAVIRRRLRQKMEFVADMMADAEPSEAELKAFVGEHPEWFRGEPRFSFSHVFLKEKSGESSAKRSEVLRQALEAGTEDPSYAGDPFMAGSEFRDLPLSDVKDVFGESFAEWMAGAAAGNWTGPVVSAYGSHLVRVTERTDARVAPFDEIRSLARREWLNVRKEAAAKALYDSLRSKYNVTIDNTPAPKRLAEVTP